MRAITPLGRGLLVVAIVALIALIVGSSPLQIVGGILLVLAASGGARARINSGQGLARLYDPERLQRAPSDAGAIGEAIERGEASGNAQSSAYAAVMTHSAGPH